MEIKPASLKSFITEKKIILALSALLVVAIAGAVYFYQKSHANPQAQAQSELQNTVKKVGRLMVLPDETPTMATVTDPEKLKSQAFFKDAKKGDKVLIFSGAQKAILYDPTMDKIVNVAPVNLGVQGAQ